jgi:hypothetical protein
MIIINQTNIPIALRITSKEILLEKELKINYSIYIFEFLLVEEMVQL